MRRRPRGKSVLRCPQCLSYNIIYDAGLITGQRYHCLACDYVGSLVLEEEVARTPEESKRP